MFSRGKLLCRLVNAGEQCNETPKYEPRIKDHHVLECHDSLKMSSSRPYKDLDVFPDPSKEKHRVNFDTQSSPSSELTDISNKQYHKDVNIGPQGEDHHILEWHSLESSFARTSQDFDVLPAPSEEMYMVGVATENAPQPSTSALLTDISNNIVPSTSFRPKGTDDFMSSYEDFSPSEEEYIRDTDEDATNCDFI
ncbi:hypothetical protein K1T71_011643 [Dendrolimus kikuchii]|uniref:Uncharacterized protein n=1 Tax=Dendrolimus kikuchii TaxID=765133 RepID=A0ACC1CLM6_9NEOP|nr:hypothetical protein K1T71_011643 [Dendrolimus kikuchii]